jgi:hypothetical protein
MDTPSSASEIFATALRELEELAREKLGSGDFAEVARIATAANVVRSLLVDGVSIEPNDAPFQGSQTEPHAGTQRQGFSTPEFSRAASRRRGYPRFYRCDERLIKVGWSKKKRSAYEHRAGKDAVFAVLDAIRRRLEKHRTFKVEDVIAVQPDSDASAVPQYVVYLVIAWMENLGLLAKNGRNGYSAHGHEFSQHSNLQLWGAIPLNSPDAKAS